MLSTNLDEYEAEEGYELKFVSAKEILDTNINHNHFSYSDITMLKREIKTVQLLIQNKYITE